MAEIKADIMASMWPRRIRKEFAASAGALLLIMAMPASAGSILDYIRNYDLNDYALGMSVSVSQNPYLNTKNSVIAYPYLTSFRHAAFTDDWLVLTDGELGVRKVNDNGWVFGAMGRIAPDLLVQDATVPRTRLPEVLRGVAEIAKRYDLKIANVFHAGDGNLHPNILFDRQNEEEVVRVERASREIMTLCVEAGGTITGEHGVGVDKRAYMSLAHNEVELDSLRSVRRVFDPEGLFNPGKVLPETTEVGA